MQTIDLPKMTCPSRGECLLPCVQARWGDESHQRGERAGEMGGEGRLCDDD
jgi:hypothetical protein